MKQEHNNVRLICATSQEAARGQPREGTPLYKLYWYVRRQRVWFLSLFGLKEGIYFDHFGLK